MPITQGNRYDEVYFDQTPFDSGSTYRVRAYAVNTAGTGYGDTVGVTTLTGWSGKIYGIAPAKINGIAVTSISKVNGV
jgi:hypothetical protein